MEKENAKSREWRRSGKERENTNGEVNRKGKTRMEKEKRG